MAIYRALIAARQGDLCIYCGTAYKKRNDELTLDHIVPKSHGGKTNLDNLQGLCKRCNNRKASIRDLTPDLIHVIAHGSE